MMTEEDISKLRDVYTIKLGEHSRNVQEGMEKDYSLTCDYMLHQRSMATYYTGAIHTLIKVSSGG